jgi:hypothetical protein
MQTAATRSRLFLAHEFVYPEDGFDTFLRNISSHNIYIAPYCAIEKSLEETFMSLNLPAGRQNKMSHAL